MYEGTISALRLDRGFGFIRMVDAPDVFFHASDLNEELPFDETLKERRVAFNIISAVRGPRAASVRPAI